MIRPARAVLALALLVSTVPARAEENDLREFRIGMAVSDLPPTGYTGFACADDPARKLESWTDYAQCAPDPSGLRALRFQYDESANPLAKVNGLYEGTKVGGHPVVLTLLIGQSAGAARVEGLVIETDPAARLYLRKKAFLFADQVRARYGDAGWTCSEGQPTGDEAPVGGVFLREHCTKTTSDRRLVLDRALFRRAGQDLKDFVSSTRLEIRGPG